MEGIIYTEFPFRNYDVRKGYRTILLKTCFSNNELKMCMYFEGFYNLRIDVLLFGGKMRTSAWEAASQIALRDCSKAAVGKVNI